jgi:hypothetical protein
MKTRFLPFVVALALLLCRGALQAQNHPTLEAGTRVRVSTTAPEPGHSLRLIDWVTGTVREANDQQLVLKVEGEGEQSAYAIPWDAIKQLEISRGVETGTAARKSAFSHILVPAVLAGTAGGTIFALLKRDLPSSGEASFRPSTKPDVLTYAVIGAGVGALAGLLGASATTAKGEEQWEPVRNLHAGIVAGPNGAGLALRLRF